MADKLLLPLGTDIRESPLCLTKSVHTGLADKGFGGGAQKPGHPSLRPTTQADPARQPLDD